MRSQRVHPHSDTGEESRETRPDGMRHATERVRLSTGRTLCSTAARVVVVSGELFSDGTDYAPETARYLEGLATLHRALAARAAAVYEVVCGIPVTWKGEKA